MKTIFTFVLSLSVYLVIAQIPKLNSYPTAKATIFMDFDGHYVSGTSWNWDGPIAAEAAVLTSDNITEIFNRVAEDFRPFNINVTTDSTYYFAAPATQRTRIIVTPTSSWYGAAGGTSYVGSFSLGDETPAFVFSTLLGNVPKKVAEAISHEAGHTLGLQHQSAYDKNCNKTAEYYAGQGTGEIGWAPIMGVGYSKNLTTWHNGTNTESCISLQSDIDIIASSTNKFGLRSDDHSNERNTATSLLFSEQSFVTSGIVNSAHDVDMFKLTINTPTNLRMSVVPNNVGAGSSGANVDIRLSILNSNGDTVGRYNPTNLLSAGVDTNINNGIYYLAINGAGTANYSDYGSIGFYSFIGSVAAALPVRKFVLKGSATQQKHALNWTYETDEPLQSFIVETSADGKNFTPLVTLPVSSTSFSYQPLQEGAAYYRLKAVTVAEERSYYSNIILLKNGKENKQVTILSNPVQNTLNLNSTGRFAYELMDGMGRLLMRGYFNVGVNNIVMPSVPSGLLLLRWNDGKQVYTEKLIKQ